MALRDAVAAPRASIVVCLAVGLAAPGPALADRVSDIGHKLDGLSAEVGRLSSGLQSAGRNARRASSDAVNRRIVDAEANFGVGNYDDAAVVLYDVVERYPKHRGWDEALYYLAESLFQKGDHVAARTYFTELVDKLGPSSKFYSQSLERLIELTLIIGDSSEADRWLAALDKAPASKQSSSVPYVRGKYYYFRHQYDKAVAQFNKVASSSRYSLQARYFLGVAQTARGALGAASRTFKELSREAGENDDERRVIELAHMALGRLYYERDQPTRAIDAYLEIDRHSEMFGDALFEAAWVYVKNKSYNKALRALELLALSDPNSYRMPEVRILEANLRIRRAQKLEEQGTGNPEEEYARAVTLFEQTEKAFDDPHKALEKILADGEDPRIFLEQITGRQSSALQTKAELPEVAVSWVRREPEVKRLIKVEGDLGEIQDEIAEAEKVVQRLELALSSPSRVNIFPSLADKRVRGTEIYEQVLTLRTALVDEATRQAGISGTERAELGRLAADRRRVEAQLQALPGAGKAYGVRISEAKKKFIELDKRASEVNTVVQFTEAQLVAIERYVASGAPSLSAERRAQVVAQMKSLRTEVDSMRAEIDEIRRQMTLARDRAGTNDAVSRRRRELRAQLRTLLDRESKYIAGLARRSPAAQRAVTELSKAGRLTASLDAMFRRIDGIVDTALADVQSDLHDEKVKLAAYKQEFANYEKESAGLSSEILGGSFGNVAKKFYQILVKTDVGVVDVAWSKQESANRRQRRLTLDQARELRTLNTEFADILREIKEEKAAEAEKKAKETEKGDKPPAAKSPGGAP